MASLIAQLVKNLPLMQETYLIIQIYVNVTVTIWPRVGLPWWLTW